MEATLTTIVAMSRQEETVYAIGKKRRSPPPAPSSYQQYHCGSERDACSPTSTCHAFPSTGTAGGGLTSSSFDSDDEDNRAASYYRRKTMAGWCYRIVDQHASMTHLQHSDREVVEIAMSYVDRYLETPAGAAARADRMVYQLTVVTSLYIALKIHSAKTCETNRLQLLRLVSHWSNGTYTGQHVVSMEASILLALQWRMNPPTAVSFVRQMLRLIPPALLDKSARRAALELARYQVQLAVLEFADSPRASVLAFCALLNALESLGCLREDVIVKIATVLARPLRLTPTGSVVKLVQMALYEAVARHHEGSELQQQQGMRMALSSSFGSHLYPEHTPSTAVDPLAFAQGPHQHEAPGSAESETKAPFHQRNHPPPPPPVASYQAALNETSSASESLPPEGPQDSAVEEDPSENKFHRDENCGAMISGPSPSWDSSDDVRRSSLTAPSHWMARRGNDYPASYETICHQPQTSSTWQGHYSAEGIQHMTRDAPSVYFHQPPYHYPPPLAGHSYYPSQQPMPVSVPHFDSASQQVYYAHSCASVPPATFCAST